MSGCSPRHTQPGKAPTGEAGVSVRLVSFDEIKANGFDLNIARYIDMADRESADLGTALVAYGDARQKRLAAERVMFERLEAAGIDVSVIGCPVSDWAETVLGSVMTPDINAVEVEPDASMRSSVSSTEAAACFTAIPCGALRRRTKA